jgi:hypothetical protein
MDKIRPFEKIALQFQISPESAKYFLGCVQKSFKTERPSHKLILEYMEAQKIPADRLWSCRHDEGKRRLGLRVEYRTSRQRGG